MLGEDGAPFLDPHKAKAYVAEGKFWVNNHAHVLSGRPGCMENRFLCHQLNQVDYQPIVTGSTRLKLTSSAMKQIELHVPPYDEQVQIADRLDELFTELDAGVAELQAAQKKLALYRQSLLKAAVEGALTAEWRKRNPPQETGEALLARILVERRARWEARQLAKFEEQGKVPAKGWKEKYEKPVQPETSGLPRLPASWVWASLDQMAELQGGLQKQPSRTPVLNKFPFLRVANVARGLLKLDDVHEVELFDGELKRLGLLEDDLLIVEGNGSKSEIGRCARWDGSIVNAVHQNHLIRARPVVMRGGFIETWINSQAGIQRLTDLAATTSGLYTLSVGKISKIPVPVAPLDEQDQIGRELAAQVEELDRMSAAVERGLRLAAAQRQNILRAAFSGQLVPQDPNDEPASVLLDRIRAERAAQGGKLSLTRRPQRTAGGATAKGRA